MKIILRFNLLLFLFIITANQLLAQNTKKFTHSIDAELHFNDYIHKAGQEASVKNDLDLHKAAFKAGYSINKHWSVGSKVVVEHAFDQEHDGGDIYLTNLYAKYKFSKKLNIQAGLINVPLCGGKSSTYGTVEVSPVEKYMSYAWRELGVSVSGTPSKKVSYKAMVSTGLNPEELNSKTVIYDARNADLGSSLQNFAIGSQFKFTPNYHWTFGTALFYSGLSNSGEQNVDLSGADYRLAEFYTQYAIGKFESRVVGVYSTISESEKINEVFHSKVGSAQYGTLVEVGYDFSDFFPLKIEESSVKGFLRAESYDAHYRTEGISDKKKYEHTDYSIGLVYQPVKFIEFKADYIFQQSGDRLTKQLFNLSVGYQF